MGPGTCRLFASNRIARCQEEVLEAESGSNGWWFLRMPQQITVSLRMHAPTARIFGLRAATNRAKNADFRRGVTCLIDTQVARMNACVITSV
jgi:hypothetical protein